MSGDNPPKIAVVYSNTEYPSVRVFFDGISGGAGQALTCRLKEKSNTETVIEVYDPFSGKIVDSYPFFYNKKEREEEINIDQGLQRIVGKTLASLFIEAKERRSSLPEVFITGVDWTLESIKIALLRVSHYKDLASNL